MSLSALVFLPSLYLCSVACRLGPGRVVPVQGHSDSCERIPTCRTHPLSRKPGLQGGLCGLLGLWRQVKQQCGPCQEGQLSRSVGTQQGNPRAEYLSTKVTHRLQRSSGLGLKCSSACLLSLLWAMGLKLSPVLKLGFVCLFCFFHQCQVHTCGPDPMELCLAHVCPKVL